jgi:hypothetical protein
MKPNPVDVLSMYNVSYCKKAHGVDLVAQPSVRLFNQPQLNPYKRYKFRSEGIGLWPDPMKDWQRGKECARLIIPDLLSIKHHSSVHSNSFLFVHHFTLRNYNCPSCLPHGAWWKFPIMDLVKNSSTFVFHTSYSPRSFKSYLPLMAF